MKLYTKTGDSGTTGLYGAERVSKTHPRVEAYGTVDELSSLIGVARASLTGQKPELDRDLEYLQNALYELAADLATRNGSAYEKNVVRMDEADAAHLEAMIDRYQEAAPPIKHFVNPGGSPTGATLHLARAVARRAEREVIRLRDVEEANSWAQVYLNRLSDLLFAMARAVNADAGISEEQMSIRGRRS